MLTLVDPSYMIRQLGQLGGESPWPAAHLTGFHPMRSENAADAWEKESLQTLQRGRREIVSVANIGGSPHLRLMRPLLADENCFECHHSQRRPKGEVFGGLSVATAVPTLWEVARADLPHRLIGHSLLWAIGLVGLVAGQRRLQRQLGHVRHVEEALEESLILAQETAANVPGAVCQFRLAPDGTYTIPYMSQGITGILGLEPAEICRDAKTVFPGMLYRPEDFEGLMSSIVDAARTMTTWRSEMQVQSVAGEIKWLQVISSPHRRPDGSIVFDGILLDITERKQAQQSLQEAHDQLERRVAQRTAELAEANRNLQTEIAERIQAEQWLLESEARFRGYFEQGLVGMAIISPDQDWEEVNRRLCDMLGYGEKELLTKTWAELTYPQDLADEQAHFRRVLDGLANGFCTDKRFIHKSGRIVHVSLWTQCLRRCDGAVDCLMVLVQDITHRKLAEENLRKEMNLSEAMLSSLPGIFCVWDETGRFLRWNKNFERVTGYDRDEIVRMDPADFFDDAEKAMVRVKMQEVFDRGQSLIEATLHSKDGRGIPYRFTGMRRQIGELRCVLAMGISVSAGSRAGEPQA